MRYDLPRFDTVAIIFINSLLAPAALVWYNKGVQVLLIVSRGICASPSTLFAAAWAVFFCSPILGRPKFLGDRRHNSVQSKGTEISVPVLHRCRKFPAGGSRFVTPSIRPPPSILEGVRRGWGLYPLMGREGHCEECQGVDIPMILLNRQCDH